VRQERHAGRHAVKIAVCLGPLQHEILKRLGDAVAAVPGTDVYDLQHISKSMCGAQRLLGATARDLVQRGALERLRPVPAGEGRIEFRRDNGEWEP
jgi:hypothetical protein